MANIITTLSVKYQSQWTVLDALREVISNAQDGQTRGKDSGVGQMSVTYSPKGRTLTVVNQGVSVPQSALLMGTSQSRERADCIGTFGEGLPMALLTLSRNDYPLMIFNGIEKWEPVIAPHPELGEDVLQIKTRQMVKDRGCFSIEIGKLEPDDWDELQGRFLSLDPRLDPEQVVRSGTERILLQPVYKGRIYCKGVFVCEKPVKYGYDVDIALNRDRGAVDEWTLKDKLGSLLSGAVYNSDAFLRRLQGILLDDEQGLEAGDSYSNLRYNSKVKNFALELYKQQYGEAIPVAKQDEVRDIEALGRRAVVVNPLMYSFVHSEFPSLQSLRGAEASKVVEVHYDLTGDEQQHLELCSGLAGVTPFVATFGSPLIRSSTRDDKLYVARHLLADPSELLVQLIREKVIADSEGGDVNGSIAKELARLALR